MTQRNPMNPRNQARSKHGDGIKGVSRKSAASAKPARPAGASVYVRSKDADKNKKSKLTRKVEKSVDNDPDARQRERKREQALASTVQDMPEYKRLRRIWWVLLVVAIVAVGLSFLQTQLLNSGNYPEALAPYQSPISIALMVVGYGCIIAALYIDIGKIRKLRKLQEEKARSLTKTQRRKLDAAIDARDEKYEAEKQARKEARAAKLPWGKKKETQSAGAQDDQTPAGD